MAMLRLWALNTFSMTRATVWTELNRSDTSSGRMSESRLASVLRGITNTSARHSQGSRSEMDDKRRTTGADGFEVDKTDSERCLVENLTAADEHQSGRNGEHRQQTDVMSNPAKRGAPSDGADDMLERAGPKPRRVVVARRDVRGSRVVLTLSIPFLPLRRGHESGDGLDHGWSSDRVEALPSISAKVPAYPRPPRGSSTRLLPHREDFLLLLPAPLSFDPHQRGQDGRFELHCRQQSAVRTTLLRCCCDLLTWIEPRRDKMAFRPALGTSTSSPLGASLRFFCDSAASAVPQVWTDAASTDGSWSAVPFARVPGSKTLWQAAFAVSRPGNFAFTYRLEHEHGRIEWLGGQGNDGAIEVLDAATAGTDTIESVFPDLRSLSLVSESSSGSASAKLFSFTLPGSQTSPVASFSLPSPTGTAYGFALERNKPTWYFPKHLSSLADLSSKLDNQLLVLSRPSHEQIVLAYPVSTPEVVTVLRGDGKGGVALRAEREALKQGKDGKAYVVLGKAPASALADLLAAAVTLGRSASTKSHRAPAPALADLQALRYCTWNSLGPQYSVKKVIKALKSFEEEGKFARAIDTVLLDDGWQDVGERPEVGGTGLRGFGAKKGWLDVDDLHDEEDEGAADASFSSSSTGAMHDSGYSSMATSPKMVHQEAGVSDRGLADLKKGVDAIKASGRGNIKRVGVWLTLAGCVLNLSSSLPSTC